MKHQKIVIDQKTVVAARASGVLAVIAIVAALWRLIIALRSVGLI